MFEAHGYYKITTQGQVLYIDAYGPWNYQAACEFDTMVREQVEKNLIGSPWAMIACLHGEGIYTPDSIPLLQKLHSWRIQSGLRHIAIIHDTKKINGAMVTESQFNKVYEADQECTCIEKYFDELADALIWIKQLGYEYLD
jgi:hypothetical protein